MTEIQGPKTFEEEKSLPQGPEAMQAGASKKAQLITELTELEVDLLKCKKLKLICTRKIEVLHKMIANINKQLDRRRDDSNKDGL